MGGQGSYEKTTRLHRVPDNEESRRVGFQDAGAEIRETGQTKSGEGYEEIGAAMTILQRKILEAASDWKAPHEIELAVGVERVIRQLQILQEVGYLEHGRSNNTYRTTSIGRAALATK